jgi:hypothetical protein
MDSRVLGDERLDAGHGRSFRARVAPLQAEQIASFWRRAPLFHDED